ncbi:SRPBCC family protein [Chitinophaga sp. GCM10012297]|uniref:SRPBCC family protein n=1 Tax=Chitinophaga chungangae TaxID=2821488 RepID=A0ABS3YHT2_9BACT|nr:SRPBCC family protein [Chitinophaga chungangae]MBO9153985.1 SRPBCC family protein [Chitinophaga chungangae]
MQTSNKTKVTIEATINAPVEKVWQYWNEPSHITQWAFASPDWHAPSAANDLRVGGTFTTRMEAKDGSFGFDFAGEYTEVEPNKVIGYTMGDGREVRTVFTPVGNETKIVSVFDAEDQNPVEMQQAGWQAILENFKKHVEA